MDDPLPSKSWYAAFDKAGVEIFLTRLAHGEDRYCPTSKREVVDWPYSTWPATEEKAEEEEPNWEESDWEESG